MRKGSRGHSSAAPEKFGAENFSGEISRQMRERVRVVELCTMAPQRRELAIQKWSHVIGDRDLFRRNSELFGRDSPEMGVKARFRQPRNQIRVKPPRSGRVQKIGGVMRRQVFSQMLREDVRVAGK